MVDKPREAVFVWLNNDLAPLKRKARGRDLTVGYPDAKVHLSRYYGQLDARRMRRIAVDSLVRDEFVGVLAHRLSRVRVYI